jgi:hypothetical protein
MNSRVPAPRFRWTPDWEHARFYKGVLGRAIEDQALGTGGAPHLTEGGGRRGTGQGWWCHWCAGRISARSIVGLGLTAAGLAQLRDEFPAAGQAILRACRPDLR